MDIVAPTIQIKKPIADARQNNKKRFTLSEDGQKIRAAQGHSTHQVSIDYPALIPPEFLYHGTSTRFVNAIAKNG